VIGIIKPVQPCLNKNAENLEFISFLLSKHYYNNGAQIMRDSIGEVPPQNEETVTITIKKLARNALLAKFIVVIGLTALFSHYWIKEASQDYEEGKKLTPQIYIEKYEEQKGKLLQSGRYAENQPLTITAAFIVIAILVGSYEVMVLVIGLLIGKLIR
jgi:hypothetical protein